MKGLGLVCALLLPVLLVCSSEPAQGPVPTAWDRETCERCLMAVSDRLHAAQLRGPDGRVRHFDDFGCALLWMDDQLLMDDRGWEAEAGVELWVRDVRGEGWVDGWSARYEGGRSTPMQYGFGPAESGSGLLALFEVWQQVRAREDERRRASR